MMTIGTGIRDTQTKYAWLSGLMFVAVVASIPIAGVLLGGSRPPVAQSIGVMIIPFAMFCWIFSTIRALHVRDLYYWMLASTYVNVAMSLIVIILTWAGYAMSDHAPAPIFGHEAESIRIMDNPLLISAMVCYIGSVLWSFFYNMRKTQSIILGITVTLIQTSLAFAVVVLVVLKWDGANAERVMEERNNNNN